MKRRKGLKFLSSVAAGLFLLYAPVRAEEDIRIRDYINDYADMIDDPTEEELNALGRSFDEQSGSQIIVVTVDSLDGKDIMKSAADLGNHNGVGDEDLDNGVVILISEEDREYFMATGSGIQGTLTDIYTSHLLDNYLVPAFREGDYSRGVKDLYVHTIDAIENGIDAGELERASSQEDETGLVLLVLGIVFALVLGIVIGAFVFLNKKKIRLSPGSTMQLHDENCDLESGVLSIRFNHPDVAEVSPFGLITAKKAGKATITLKKMDGSIRMFYIVVCGQPNTAARNEKNMRFYFRMLVTTGSSIHSDLHDRHDHFDDFSGGGSFGGGFSGGGGSFNGGGSGGSW